MGSGSSRRRGAAVPVGKAPERRERLQTALADGEEAAALPTPGRRAPAAAGTPPVSDGGRCGDAAAGGGGGTLLPQAALSTRSPMSPENNNADHQNHKEKLMRHFYKASVRDMSLPRGQGNDEDLLHWVTNKRKLNYLTSKSCVSESACTKSNGSSLPRMLKKPN